MLHGTAQAVQPPDNQDIATLKSIEAFRQTGAFGLRPGHLVHENAGLGDAVFCESFDLQ